MPGEPRPVSIRGFNYAVTPLGARTGHEVRLRLRTGTPADIAFAREKFIASTKLEIVDPVRGTGTWIDLAGQFDDHFAARYEALEDWMSFATEVNFGSFLADLTAKAAAAVAAARSGSPSPSPETGASGGSSASQL